MSTAWRARTLYRRCIRLGRSWVGKEPDNVDAERAFIVETTREEFRRHRSLPPEEAEHQLNELEKQIEIALHYKIPYPRLHNCLPAAAIGGDRVIPKSHDDDD
eukprot:tig00021133_g18907.t1